jgi:hypothetical protein
VLSSHLIAKFHNRPPRVLAGSFLHQLKGDFFVVDDDHRLSKDGDGAEWPIALFVLQPVLVLRHSWSWQIVDVTNEW